MIRLRGWNAQGLHCIFYDSNFCYFNVITCNYRGVSMKPCNVMSLFPFFIVCGISFTTIRHSIQCVSSHPSHCFLCHARSNCCPLSILFQFIIFPCKMFCFHCRCVAVLQGRNFQDNIINTSRKAITALAFSADGRYLALGEV